MKISTQVLDVLGNAITDGPKLVLTGQLDRKLYLEVNKVLEANGGKWIRLEKAHVFQEDAADAIEQALATGEFRSVKQDLGQFDTPSDLVDQIVGRAQVRPGMWCYEPSAGIGNIVEGLVRALGSGASVWGNEIDTKRYAACQQRHHNAFGSGGLSMKDFLQIEPGDEPAFDRVVMNPPFARQADIDHVRHASLFLKPGGRLVSIMSQAVMFRTNRKTLDFRAWVAGLDGTLEPLPAGSFSTSGTQVSACVLTVEV